MPSNYEKELARIREESCRREEVYRVRYSSGPPATALRLAERWRAVLSREPLDWAELSAIREEARENKIIADIAFFGFINELEKDYCLLRQAELESR
jgi:hypothetical protein